jgi:hypothetical protein
VAPHRTAGGDHHGSRSSWPRATSARPKHPFSGKIAAAFRAETAIDRRDFGVPWNAAMDTGAAYLGERVQVSLAILAVRLLPLIRLEMAQSPADGLRK